MIRSAKAINPGRISIPPPTWDADFEFSGQGFGDQGQDYSTFFEALFGGDQAQRRPRSQTQFSAKGQDHHARILIDLEEAFKGGKQSIVRKSPELGTDGRTYLKERTLKVTIPKGIEAGKHIRLKGQGMPGMGQGGAGDLYLEIGFKPHAFNHAEGKDLYLNLPGAVGSCFGGNDKNSDLKRQR